jgi:(Z)-2-((N-methylformamido)methylene)-5-hydroxybutyrolactone dehydrogenase
VESSLIEAPAAGGVRVNNDVRAAREEIFGPVLSVIPFEGEEDLIRQANDTRYGLAAGIWTRNIQKAHRVVYALRAGTVWVKSPPPHRLR